MTCLMMAIDKCNVTCDVVWLINRGGAKPGVAAAVRDWRIKRLVGVK